MDKKKILLLVGGGALIVIVAVVTQYLAMKNKGYGSPSGTLVPSVTEESKVFFTSTSITGTVQSINAEKVVITTVDGGTEEYISTDFISLYDDRARGVMQPIKFEDIKIGMRVQISVSTNQSDKTQTKSLIIYE